MQMMRARCKRCQYVFDGAALPMPVTEVANALSNCHCPMCGNLKGNTVAEPRPLNPEETIAKARAISMERTA